MSHNKAWVSLLQDKMYKYETKLWRKKIKIVLKLNTSSKNRDIIEILNTNWGLIVDEKGMFFNREK